MARSTQRESVHEVFRRYRGNPILTPSAWPYPVNAVFNPGAIEHVGETVLLVRVEDLQGFSHLTLARSRDGLTRWRISPTPTLVPDPQHDEERWGIEDPRIVWLQEHQQYAVTYVSFSRGGPVVSLALTPDFRRFTRLGPLLPPEDKDASLFPRRIGGRYVLIHRPIIRGEAHIWISTSPDLRFWGEHRVLIPARPGWWDCHRVGLGPPPLETPQGWLLIYHGVRLTTSGSLYRVGMALLDLDQPWRVICRCREWVLAPTQTYEWMGNVPGVVFPTGAVVNRKTQMLHLYYGAADTVIGVASANLDDVLTYLKRCPQPETSES